jgi:hypothetical protein
LNATRHGDRAIVGEHIAVERIKSGIVDVGDEHAFAQIVEHDNPRDATESTKARFERKPEVVYHLWPGLLPVSEAERGRVPQLTEETNTPLSLPPPGESIDDPPPQPNKRQPVVTIEPDEPTTSKIFRGSGRSEIFIEIQ